MERPGSDGGGVEPAGHGRSRLRYLLPVLAAGWLVAVPLLGLSAIGRSVTFLGEQPTMADRAATARGLVVAAGVALGIAVVGAALSVGARSRAGGVVFVVLLVLSLGVAAVAGAYAHELHRDDPTPPSGTRSPACQEYSGGDTRCPGG